MLCQSFYEIFTTCYIQNGPKIKNAQNILKFGTCDISNILISILMSKIFFMKYLPTVRLKLVPKLKVVRIYWNLSHITNMSIWILMSKVIFIKYLPPARPKLVPKLKMLRIYWNLVHLIFRIPRSRFWCQKIIFIKYFPFAQNLFKFDKNWNLTKIFDKNYFWH